MADKTWSKTCKIEGCCGLAYCLSDYCKPCLDRIQGKKKKYRLNFPSMEGLTSACNKCRIGIIITEDAKPEFMKVMGWDEEKFNQLMEELPDEKDNASK